MCTSRLCLGCCRLEFDQDEVPDLTSEIYLQDIHSISSLLKMYFRELPNPLLTYQLYDKFQVSVLSSSPVTNARNGHADAILMLL